MGQHGALVLSDVFGREHGYIYNLCYLILIYFFCYFWTAITFNPKDMADNSRTSARSFPAIGPASGRPITWKR